MAQPWWEQPPTDPSGVASAPPRPPVPPPPPSAAFGPGPFGPAPQAPGNRASGRRVDIDVRNLVLGLGVASLVAAAVSFVAVNWDAFDATMRASLLIGVTVASVALGTMARTRHLGGTATALSWLTMVLAFVDLFAIERAAFAGAPSLAVTAIGGGVLFAAFLLMGWWQPGAAMRTGAAAAWMLGWWSAFGYWEVTGPDLWMLPPAVVLGWLQWRTSADNPTASSWERYGVALAVAAGPAVLTALGDPNTVRPVLLIAVVTVGLLVGLRLRQLALIRVAGVSLAVLVGAQLVDVLRGVPGWAVFALVGVALLTVGAAFEYRLRRNGSTDSVECP
ncbi:MAG TPA: hypothetical protein VFN21_11465 [Acidimicrobiales bacterium]|nr:hypothetical protein [Acidimicrobiales bacterium]